MNIRLKRAYEPAVEADGYRVLIDRLWPRGVSKDDAAIDCWAKDLAPSTQLRKWFGHEVARWPEFQRRFRHELGAQGDLLAGLRARARQGPVTLVYGARDQQHNDAVVLKAVLEEAR